MGLGWSLHRNGAWRAQLARVERWIDRLRTIAGTGSHTDSDLEDFVFAFFQNCFQLRDWVKETSNISDADLNSFMARDPMKVCRDIANGTKHLNISRPSVDAGFSIVREYDQRSPHGYRLSIIAGKEKYDLLDLASQCLAEWKTFLEPHVTDVADALPAAFNKSGA